MRAFPVAQIRLSSHKIVYSSMGAFPVTKIRPNWHKSISCSMRACLVAHINLNLHKIVPFQSHRSSQNRIVCSMQHESIYYLFFLGSLSKRGRVPRALMKQVNNYYAMYQLFDATSVFGQTCDGEYWMAYVQIGPSFKHPKTYSNKHQGGTMD